MGWSCFCGSLGAHALRDDRGAKCKVCTYPRVFEAEEDAEAVGQTPRCEKGHALEAATTTKEMGCDGCSRFFDAGSTLHGCAECDYDLCRECVDAAAAATRSEPKHSSGGSGGSGGRRRKTSASAGASSKSRGKGGKGGKARATAPSAPTSVSSQSGSSHPTSAAAPSASASDSASASNTAMPLSAYELAREAKIRENKAVLSSLGLDQFSAPPKLRGKRTRPKNRTGSKTNTSPKKQRGAARWKTGSKAKPVEGRRTGSTNEDDWAHYASQTEAARKCGINVGSVSQCVSGKQSEAGGFQFRYILQENQTR